MTVSDAEFKTVLARFPTGVTVVTTCDGERPAGVTVNAFASVSLDPPLVMVCIDRRSHMHDLVARTGFFAANILGAHQQEVSRRFAGQTGDRNERFRLTPYHEAVTGAPILDGSIAHVECRVTAIYPGGDHSIFLGQVVGLGSAPGEPLIYYRARYGALDMDAGAGIVSGRRE
ncbi:MAG TPA: flavin reductase family protein [Ktedonobacterales bacterium]|jgi:flavin reductase (DIM6/NTAB) family NADH-FMN oxidoreductase RutF|nr:flavin reductase family protein [Ktedonobacterales bacterium]